MTRYEICVSGSRARDWKGWFRELEVQSASVASPSKAELVFTGNLSDQSALLGILLQMHNLNLKIHSVHILDEEEGNKQWIP